MWLLCLAPSRPSKHPERRKDSTTDRRPSSPLQPIDFGLSALPSSTGSQSGPLFGAAWKPSSIPTPKVPAPAPALGHIREAMPMPFILQPPEEQTDNWDDDFEEGISFTKLHGSLWLSELYREPCVELNHCFTSTALENSKIEDEKQETDDNARTIRPTRSPGGPSVPLPLAKPPAVGIAPIVEDYSDLGSEEDDDKLQEKVADFKVQFLPQYMHLFYQ